MNLTYDGYICLLLFPRKSLLTKSAFLPISNTVCKTLALGGSFQFILSNLLIFTNKENENQEVLGNLFMNSRLVKKYSFIIGICKTPDRLTLAIILWKIKNLIKITYYHLWFISLPTHSEFELPGTLLSE